MPAVSAASSPHLPPSPAPAVACRSPLRQARHRRPSFLPCAKPAATAPDLAMEAEEDRGHVPLPGMEAVVVPPHPRPRLASSLPWPRLLRPPVPPCPIQSSDDRWRDLGRRHIGGLIQTWLGGGDVVAVTVEGFTQA
ncbi:hypothetical protein SEVIR_9G081851v4 [Setaria viridis]